MIIKSLSNVLHFADVCFPLELKKLTAVHTSSVLSFLVNCFCNPCGQVRQECYACSPASTLPAKWGLSVEVWFKFPKSISQETSNREHVWEMA